MNRRISICAIAVAGCCLAIASTALAGTWRKLGDKKGGVAWFAADFTVDTTGTPWLMGGGKVFWWNGEDWVEALDENGQGFSSGQYLTKFFGGPDRGAYMCQRGKDEHAGILYKLARGKVERVSDFYYDVAHEYPGVYVSKKGDVFNWSQGFLAILRDGKWDSVETRLSNRPWDVEILDMTPDGPVLFTRNGQTTANIWDGAKFRTKVEMPGLKPYDPQQGWSRTCRWGKNRAFLFRYGQPGLTAVEIADEIKVVDITKIQDSIGRASVYDGWTTLDGSTWLLISSRDGTGYAFCRVATDGTVSRLEDTRQFGWDNSRIRQSPETILQTKDGAIWFALPQDGIRRWRDGKIEEYGWKQGFLAPSIRWLFESPDGHVYAAGQSSNVYVWDESGTADDSLTKDWDEVVCVSYGGPLADLSGRLWMARADQPGKISRWDGKTWEHFAVSFELRQLTATLADDRGHLLLAGNTFPEMVIEIGPDSQTRYASLTEAISARVKAGATRFKSKTLLGPIVTKDSRICFAHRGYGRFGLFHDDAWDEIGLQDIQEMFVGDDGEPYFFTQNALWVYRGGRLQKLSETGQLQGRLRIATEDGFQTLPFVPNLPRSFRETHIVLASGNGQQFFPIGWGEAEGIAKGNPVSSQSPLTPGISYPAWALPDSSGGWWIKSDNTNTLRWLGGSLIPLTREGTPLTNGNWAGVGLDATGRVWVNAGYYGAGQHIFLRKTDGLPIEIKSCDVIGGRRVRIEWESKGAAVAVGRVGSGDWKAWRRGQPVQLPVQQLGKQTLVVTLRAMDSVGLLGLEQTKSVTVEVRLPDTQLTVKQPPKIVGDIVWKPPVKGVWTDENVSHDIEWRADDGDWQKLTAGGFVPVASLNRKSVTFQFRAVEDDIFADPEPVSISLFVDTDTEAALRDRVAMIPQANAELRKQIVEALLTSRELSLRILQEQMTKTQSEWQQASANNDESAKALRAALQALSEVYQELSNPNRKR